MSSMISVKILTERKGSTIFLKWKSRIAAALSALSNSENSVANQVVRGIVYGSVLKLGDDKEQQFLPLSRKKSSIGTLV